MDDGSDLAIISGSGKLPLLIKNTYKKAIYFSFSETVKETENKVIKCKFEKLGFLFDSLKKNQIRRVVMAGAINRPQFDQSKLDEYTLSIMPMLTDKLVQGDNEHFFIADEFKKMVANYWCLRNS